MPANMTRPLMLGHVTSDNIYLDSTAHLNQQIHASPLMLLIPDFRAVLTAFMTNQCLGRIIAWQKKCSYPMRGKPCRLQRKLCTAAGASLLDLGHVV